MKGDFFVHQIDDVVYSTNDVFWASFYTDKPLPGVEIQKGKLEPTDFTIVTHKGKVIYRVPDRSKNDEC